MPRKANTTERLKVERVAIASLRPDPANARRHGERNLESIKASLTRFGQQKPIVVLADGRTIVDGFHRWTVAGDKKVAALTGGLVPVVAVDADETQRIAATIRHNRARGEHSIKPMSGTVSGLLESGLSIEEVMAELGTQREEVLRLPEHRGMPSALGAGKSFGEAWTPE